MSTTYVPWKNGKFPWLFCGQTKARFLEYANMEKAVKVLKEFDRLYGNGNPVIIGDCVPNDPTVTIPGHPAGSHRKNALDMNYLVKKGGNYTQYMAGDGAQRVAIWNKDGSLKVSVFDLNRTAKLMALMMEAFPKAHVFIDTRIGAAFPDEAFSHEQWERIQEDAPEHNNHHLHMHWKLRG